MPPLPPPLAVVAVVEGLGVAVIETVGEGEAVVALEGEIEAVSEGVPVRLGEGFIKKDRPRGSRATPLPPPSARAGASNPVASPLLRNREPIWGPLACTPTALSPLKVLSTQDT